MLLLTRQPPCLVCLLPLYSLWDSNYTFCFRIIIFIDTTRVLSRNNYLREKLPLPHWIEP